MQTTFKRRGYIYLLVACILSFCAFYVFFGGVRIEPTPGLVLSVSLVVLALWLLNRGINLIYQERSDDRQ